MRPSGASSDPRVGPLGEESTLVLGGEIAVVRENTLTNDSPLPAYSIPNQPSRKSYQSSIPNRQSLFPKIFKRPTSAQRVELPLVSFFQNLIIDSLPFRFLPWFHWRICLWFYLWLISSIGNFTFVLTFG